MQPQAVLVVLIIVYLSVLVGVGVYASRARQTVKGGFLADYFLGGRSLSGFVLAMTLVATYTSASSFLGGPGTAYNQGLGWVLLAVIQLPSMYVTLGVLGKRFAIIGRKINAVTVIDFLRERYDNNKFVTISSAVFIVAFLIAAVAAQFLGGARLFQSVTGYSYLLCLILFTAVVMVYVTLGGFVAVALNDAINGTMMFIGTVVLLVTTIVAGGGLPAIMTKVAQINPDLITPFGVDNFISVPWISSFWILVCIGILGLPQNAVRAMTFKNSKAMHQAIVIGTVVVGMLMLGMHLVGVLARAIVPVVANSDMTIPTLALQVLHPVVAAFVLAAPLAAIMSTVDSQLIYIAGTIVKDVYLNYINPTAPESGIKRLSQGCNIVLSLVILALAIKPPSMIVWINLFAFGGLQAAFFFPLVGGLYWKRANVQGAIAAQLAGVLSFIWFTAKMPRPLGLHPIVPTLGISLAAFLLVSLATPAPKMETIQKFWG
ncbi:MAG: sodium/pantothenate symporter [bacterium]|jgi:sodium/pantothenate symporter